MYMSTWRKWNLPMAARMYSDAASFENNLEVPQNVK